MKQTPSPHISYFKISQLDFLLHPTKPQHSQKMSNPVKNTAGVAWNKKSKYIHYVDRQGNISTELKPVGKGSSPAQTSGSRSQPSASTGEPANTLERVVADGETKPKGAKASSEGKKPEAGEKKPKIYRYIDRNGVISTSEQRLSKNVNHFVYRHGTELPDIAPCRIVGPERFVEPGTLPTPKEKKKYDHSVGRDGKIYSKLRRED